ncbi:MAG: phosphohistidine phosphatase SixA [Thermoproteota archaeon]
MVQLYILRHGEAGKRMPAASSSIGDDRRSLTAAGRDEVKEVARALAALKVRPDLVATSPLARARETAEIVAKTLKVKKGGLEEWAELKPEGRRPDFYKKLAQLKPEASVMIVGHEPNLSTITAEMVFGTASPGKVVLKKAGLAKLTVTSLHPRPQAELRWLLAPKHLKKMLGSAAAEEEEKKGRSKKS